MHFNLEVSPIVFNRGYSQENVHSITSIVVVANMDNVSVSEKVSFTKLDFLKSTYY